MFSNDITNNVNSSNVTSQSIQAVIIESPFVNNLHHPHHQKISCANSMPTTSPTCIVIGCKNGNGNSNPSLKYYQVPNLNTNHIARQWYINTLREDLLDYLLNNQGNLQQIQHQHFVCIEHFDEESFIISDNNNTNCANQQQQQTMMLKDDAVPSLFEIEVFQKMISHQEQIALNQQQQKQLIQYKNVESSSKQQPTQSLLSSLILSEQPTVLSSLNSNYTKNSKSNQSPNNINNNNSGKRPRIDPDIRAALMQRVPKAVKRTTVYSLATSNTNTSKTINQLIPENSSQLSSSQSIKIPKAVKHTMPRNQTNTINEIAMPPTTNSNHSVTLKSTSSQSLSTINNSEINNNNNNNPASNLKFNKAVKHTSSYLKDILPPPIMQSTKRPTINKAIKHTGGAPSSFYQTLNKQNNNNNNNNQPLSQLNLNTVDLSTSSSAQNCSNNQTTNSNNSNKITITTTYVYKRVSQPPEIDLQLECEEEEYIYLKSPTPPPSPSPLTEIETSSQIPEIKLETTKSMSELSSNKPDENLIENDDIIQESRKELSIITKIAAKPSNYSNKVKSSDQMEIEDSEKSEFKSKLKNNSNKNLIDNSNLFESSSKKLTILPSSMSTNKNNSNISSKINDIYLNVLSKYYSRRLSAFSATLEQSTSSNFSSSNNKKSQKTLPPDLRIGNYPAKVNFNF